MKSIKKIFLCHDPDEPGQKGAREVARRLGYDRCLNIVLPDNQDINEFFRSGKDIFDFEILINQAGPFDVAGVLSIEKVLDQFLEEIKKPELQNGILTPWPSVNRLIPTGFQPGDLVVLSAPPKVGKKSLAMNITSYASLNDIPALFFCLEMRPVKLIQKIVQSEAKTETVGAEEISKVRKSFSGKPLYLGYCYQKPDLNGIVETLKFGGSEIWIEGAGI